MATIHRPQAKLRSAWTSPRASEGVERRADDADASRAAYRSRPYIEDALRLPIQLLRRARVLREGQWVGTVTGLIEGQLRTILRFEAEVWSEGGRLKLFEADIEGVFGPGGRQRLDLVTTAPRYGGRRWWFQCATTGSRAAVLLHFDGVDGFHSRLAFDPVPTYRCQRTSTGTHVYERIQRIHERLGFAGALFDIPPRPKYMNRLVYARLLASLYHLWHSPEMPLMRFVNALERDALTEQEYSHII